MRKKRRVCDHHRRRLPDLLGLKSSLSGEPPSSSGSPSSAGTSSAAETALSNPASRELGPVSAQSLWKHLVSRLRPSTDVKLLKIFDELLGRPSLATRIQMATGGHPSHVRLKTIYSRLCDCLDLNEIFDPAQIVSSQQTHSVLEFGSAKNDPPISIILMIDLTDFLKSGVTWVSLTRTKKPKKSGDHKRAPALFLSCEHAGNQIPTRYKKLFSSNQGVLKTHRGSDPGAFVVGKEIGRLHSNGLLFHKNLTTRRRHESFTRKSYGPLPMDKISLHK